MYLACDVAQMLASYGKDTTKDPIVHFYEDFLEAFDPQVRKALGVWYTPLPVVNFMVRTLDTLLKEQFNLPQGLADTSKIKIQTKQDNKIAGFDIEEKEYHRVQILDPATGTGTFLAQIIEYIAQQFKEQRGIWQNYVQEHLLPRLNGFELLMASYAIAHLKLDMLLSQTQITESTNRIQIYLTNSLEEPTPDRSLPLARWLSDEANEANRIKRDTPVMCVIGNPPYNGESVNNGKWISDLINKYKKDHKGKVIPNTKWVNNDYVKFIRFGEYFIQRNGQGLLTYITDNSFLDSLSFNGMRHHLLRTFDKIYIINLHGNSKIKETTPDGTPDENVFNIMQGVSISIFVKAPNTAPKEQLAEVYYYDLYGKRTEKFAFLDENSLNTIPFSHLTMVEPHYFFTPKDFSLQEKYDSFFSIKDLFMKGGVGICSKRDDTAIQFTKEAITQVVKDFNDLDEATLKSKYPSETKESRDKKTAFAKANIQKMGIKDSYLQPITYRPFDIRWTYFTNQSKGFLAYPTYEIMQHFIKGENLALVVSKQTVEDFRHIFVTKNIANLNLTGIAARYGAGYVFPLYLYEEEATEEGQTLKMDFHSKKIPNLNPEILKKLGGNLLTAFDYCYGVLHDKNYREQYKEFLKIDFPRIPYPKDNEELQHYATIGKHLRELHLLESPEVQTPITIFPIAGTNVVESVSYVAGNVYINDIQYFGKVPLEAWETYIGGYQPAQKWLKDRKGQTLTYNDIIHYQQMITALFLATNDK